MSAKTPEGAAAANARPKPTRDFTILAPTRPAPGRSSLDRSGSGPPVKGQSAVPILARFIFFPFDFELLFSDLSRRLEEPGCGVRQSPEAAPLNQANGGIVMREIAPSTRGPSGQILTIL